MLPASAGRICLMSSVFGFGIEFLSQPTQPTFQAVILCVWDRISIQPTQHLQVVFSIDTLKFLWRIIRIVPPPNRLELILKNVGASFFLFHMESEFVVEFQCRLVPFCDCQFNRCLAKFFCEYDHMVQYEAGDAGSSVERMTC